MTLIIEFSNDQQMAAWKAKAESQGLTLEEWIKKLADENVNTEPAFAEQRLPQALTPSHAAMGVLEKEAGVWVLRTGQPIPSAIVEETLQSIRLERDLDNLGPLH